MLSAYIACLGRDNTGIKSPVKKCQQELNIRVIFPLRFQDQVILSSSDDKSIVCQDHLQQRCLTY